MLGVARLFCNTLPPCTGYIESVARCQAAFAALYRAVRGVLQKGVASQNFCAEGCCKNLGWKRGTLCQRTAVERLSEQASVELPHTASCIHATVKLKGKGRHNRRNQDCLSTDALSGSFGAHILEGLANIVCLHDLKGQSRA